VLYGSPDYESRYLELCEHIMMFGTDIYNERTEKVCRTSVGHTIKFSASDNTPPVLTTKQSFPVAAVAEILGYLRKYTNAQDFANIGSPTWFANANQTPAWLDNPNRKGKNDMGLVYGAALNEGELEKVVNNLSQGIDDRGETITFWKPEVFDKGCLRPCMRTHTFSIVGDTLHLTSESRSVDVALGLNFNSIQCYFLLKVIAQICGLKAGMVTHNMINVHIYEDHFQGVEKMLSRDRDFVESQPVFKISDWVADITDITDKDVHAREYFSLTGYEHLGKINFEMAV